MLNSIADYQYYVDKSYMIYIYAFLIKTYMNSIEHKVFKYLDSREYKWFHFVQN